MFYVILWKSGFVLFSAVDAGIAIVNEVGLDPGIDHMLAMECFDDVKAEGGVVCWTISHFEREWTVLVVTLLKQFDFSVKLCSPHVLIVPHCFSYKKLQVLLNITPYDDGAKGEKGWGS